MVSTRKKKQQHQRLSCQIMDFYPDVFFDESVSSGRQIVVLNSGPADREFTATKNDSIQRFNENTMNVQTRQRCLTDRIDREMSTIVETVEDRIQNGFLTSIDIIITPRIELAVRLVNASSGPDTASVTANSDCGEHIRIIISFKNVSNRNNTLDELYANDETRGNMPDELSEFLVPRTLFD